ncbi:MAG TPA: WecB/TagA/CpsF family glycosyltransferase [Phenylobacterium sp.]|nr:WecB/TagA/CpsF family glycosyltransferase [Phenylobacterium sp.]
MTPPARLRLLGAEVDLITPADMLATVERWVAAGQRGVVANHNLHSLHFHGRSKKMRAFFEAADLIQIDSMPMIAWGRLVGLPLRRQHRSTYLDWREDFWSLADACGWRVFYLGGAPGVAEEACRRLSRRWPGVSFGARDGYFKPNEDAAVVDQINAFAPDIVFVGMGMPRQETWILKHHEAIRRGVLFNVGAAFDYEAGAQTAAPRWAGRIGLEWLFRLLTQPQRLAYRYLIEPWSLLPAAVGDVQAALRGDPRIVRPA